MISVAPERRIATNFIKIYDVERAADITSGQDWASGPVYVTDVTLRQLFRPSNFVTIIEAASGP